MEPDRTSPAYKNALKKFYAVQFLIQGIVALTPTQEDDFYVSLFLDGALDKFQAWWDRKNPPKAA